MDYESNISAVINDLTKEFKTDTNATVLSRVAAEQLLGDIVHRIHNEGKNASGGQIAGNYSTKPIYVSLTAFVRQGSPKGKTSNSATLKNGKPRKSSYFQDGYKGFKQNQTGNTNVNLVLTGQLQNDLLIGRSGENFGLSFGSYGLELSKNLEAHYSAIIWFPTDKEYKNMTIAINEYLNKNLSK